MQNATPYNRVDFKLINHFSSFPCNLYMYVKSIKCRISYLNNLLYLRKTVNENQERKKLPSISVVVACNQINETQQM